MQQGSSSLQKEQQNVLGIISQFERNTSFYVCWNNTDNIILISEQRESIHPIIFQAIFSLNGLLILYQDANYVDCGCVIKKMSTMDKIETQWYNCKFHWNIFEKRELSES